jgi:hypothetical protein
MVAPALVAATSLHWAPEAVRLAAWKIVRAGQNLARAGPGRFRRGARDLAIHRGARRPAAGRLAGSLLAQVQDLGAEAGFGCVMVADDLDTFPEMHLP